MGRQGTRKFIKNYFNKNQKNKSNSGNITAKNCRLQSVSTHFDEEERFKKVAKVDLLANIFALQISIFELKRGLRIH